MLSVPYIMPVKRSEFVSIKFQGRNATNHHIFNV